MIGYGSNNNSLLKEALRQKQIVENKKKEKEELKFTVNTKTPQYKALIKRLEKYDNEKTDAVRMALLYLEDRGKTIDINSFENYIK